MINCADIQNFKCFAKHTTIDLANITICVGMNSVGKSSLIQALLLMRQSYDVITKYKKDSEGEYKILLNNVYALQLGSVEQVMSSDDSENILIGVDGTKFKYHGKADKLSLYFSNPFSRETDRIEKNLFSSKFYYLNAERLGPRNYQNMESNEFLHCGFHGEYTFDVIDKCMVNRVNNKRLFKSAERLVPTFEKQVEYWLNYIVNGVEITFLSDLHTQLTQMQIQQPVLDTGFSSPYNFGFGISYVLPIIVTGLLAESGSIMIVENPEAHLHPAGQSRIGRFLSQVASDKVQVIIETHSEHVINGIRINSLENDIAPQDICINYFSIDTQKQAHCVERIAMNERMDILEWPEGFADQEEKDLKELRLLRRKKSDSTGVMGR